MFSRFVLAFIVAAVAFQFTPLRADSKSPSAAFERNQNSDNAKEALTDAGVIAHYGASLCLSNRSDEKSSAVRGS